MPLTRVEDSRLTKAADPDIGSAAFVFLEYSTEAIDKEKPC